MMDRRHHFRRQAIQRRRDPEIDARVAESSAAARERFAAALAKMPAVQQLAAAVQAAEQSTAGTG